MTFPSTPRPFPGEVPDSPRSAALRDLVERVSQRARAYLEPRSDAEEQADHLRHVADRTRWIYYSELQRANPGLSVRVSEHEDALIEACAFSHDIGKWIPRDDLRRLVPEDRDELLRRLAELELSRNQCDLFELAVRRRFDLAQDGYTPEYDSAHHLVSAFILAADPALNLQCLDRDDRVHLLRAIVGHQFGSYFKESLLNLSLLGRSEITTGMLMDVSRPERLLGDLLGSSFHDADISDLLFIGSLERRPNREDIFHTGGLVKILMINFTNRIFRVPSAPADVAGCVRSCLGTVNSACKEFLTQTAVDHSYQWRRLARRFLAMFQEKGVEAGINAALGDEARPAPDRLTAVRSLTRLQAREFLNRSDENN
jgi:hypothetical protein